MPKLTQAEGVRLYKNRGMQDNTVRAQSMLTTLGACNLNKAGWTLTFNNDFTDVAGTVLNLTDTNPYVAGQFYAKGSYDVIGLASTVSKTFDPGNGDGTLYKQGAASELWLGIGNYAGTSGVFCGSMESGRQIPGTSIHDVEDGTTIISEGFYQAYGLFEAKLKLPPVFRTDTAVVWPSFWMYSDRWNMPDRPVLELDIFEMYLGSKDNVSRADDAFHQAMHTHDSIRALLEPGYICRDYQSSNIHGMSPSAVFGTDSAFDFGADWHLYQMYITPEFMYSGFDDLIFTKYYTLDAYHTELYMLLSIGRALDLVGTGTKAGVTSFIEDTTVWLKADWIRAYQNPDWVGLSLGGTADARTVTTGMAMVGSYEDGRILSCISHLANATTAPTLNANSLGAKVIKKYSDYDGVKNGPYTGTFVALSANDLTNSPYRYNFKYSASGNCWILLNPANPINTRPTCYVSPTPTVSPIVIDLPAIEAIEGKLLEEWGHPALLPDGHSGKDTLIDSTQMYARVPPNISFDTIVGKPVGSMVGTLPIFNIPSGAARCTLSGSSNYKVNPGTGVVSVAPGANLVAGSEEFEANWWTMGVPLPKGASTTTVTVNVKADQPFDAAAYFGTQLGGAWYFDDVANLTLAGSDIITCLDSSSYHLDATQSDATHRVTWSATGLNNKPAAINLINTHRLILPHPYIPTPFNAVTGLNIWNDGSASIGLNNIHRHCVSYDFSVPHSIYFEWTTLEVFCWINGNQVNVTQQTGSITSNGWMLAFGRFDAPSGSGGAIYNANETNACLFSTNGAVNGVVGTVTAILAAKAINSSIGRDKVIADLHWRAGYQNLLPSNHPYRNVAPTLYG